MLKPKIPLDFYPTFKTECFQRNYALNVKVSVECAHKTFNAEYEQELLLLMDPCAQVIRKP